MRLRRKSTRADEAAEQEGPGSEAGEPSGGDPTTSATGSAEGLRADGPWDAAELAVSEDDQTRAHLGALSINGHPEVELRLQVDEASEQVTAVMLIAKDGAMELRAFAAPRNEDLWDDVRPRMAGEAQRRGGRVAEVEGPYGPALRIEIPARDPQGQQVVQGSTVMGIAGPRWMLRVTMFGRPATDWQPDALLERTLRSAVVNRGSEPMAPGDTLPLVLPPQARRVGTPR